jgi:hypothetical protein
MAKVLEEFTTEEQRSVVGFFLWTKGLNAKDIHEKFCCLRREVFVA